MHIERMRIADVPPFTKEVTLPFHEQVNVFIGPNASGKSTLLSSLAYSSNEDRAARLTPSSDWLDSLPRESARDFVNNYSREYGRSLAVDRPAGSDRVHLNWDKLPWVHIPAERISLPKEPDFLKFSSGEQHDQYINELLQHDGRYIETEKVCKALLTPNPPMDTD